MISFSRQQNILWQLTLVLVILANALWLHWPIVGIFFGIIYLWLNSRKIADIFAPNIHQGFKNLIGLILIISYVSLVYTLAYHVYKMDFWVWLFIFASIPFFVESLSFFYKTRHYYFTNTKFGFFSLSNIRKAFFPMIVFILDIVLLVGLYKNATEGVVRSPWELLTYKFWSVFILSNIFLLFSIIDKKARKNITLISWHFLMLSSMAVILYPLGFGYDSFIHGAALKIINDTGSLEPRLFLYIGQYGLTFFIHHLSQVSFLTINKWLMPFLFSIIWPSSLYYGLRYGFNWSFKTSYLATLWSLFVGFSFAIMTTPQSLGFLLFALVIFILPVINKKRISIYFAWIITATALTIHPLAGLPLFFFTAHLAISRLRKYKALKIALRSINTLVAAIILPLFFAIYQKMNGLAWADIFTFQPQALLNVPNIHWAQSYSFPLDMLHNLGANQAWIYALITLLGLYFIYRNSKYIFFRRLFVFVSILIINYILASVFLSFNLQISYQKSDYINRIAYLIALGVLPIFLTSIYFWFQKILKNSHSIWSKSFLIVITVLIITISTYFSYPIYDKHANSKSFNVTGTDIKTVQQIEEHAAGQEYIVLANQMVGVAAIDQFGFAHYYNQNFYYSMPLGVDNIYQNYLGMMEEQASREQALEAMDKTGVDKLYLVVNNYWHSAKRAIAEAENTADEKILVDNGVNTIFVYNR